MTWVNVAKAVTPTLPLLLLHQIYIKSNLGQRIRIVQVIQSVREEHNVQDLYERIPQTNRYQLLAFEEGYQIQNVQPSKPLRQISTLRIEK